MNAIAERPSFVVEWEGLKTDINEIPSSVAVGNVVYMVEVSNVIVGSIQEVFEDLADSEIAAIRSNEDSRPMEAVFAELGIA